MTTAARRGGRPVLLLTRPSDRSSPLAATYETAGVRTLSWPILDIQTALEGTPDAQNAQAVVLTSPRALDAVPDAFDLPAYCVGSTTAQAASEAGYRDVRDAEGDADDLAALITQDLTPADGPLLYLRGRDVSRDINALLPEFTINEIVTYRAVANPSPPPDVYDAISEGRLAAIAFFSPRTAAIFSEALPEPLRNKLGKVIAVAMSARVAEKLSNIAFCDVAIADEPTATSMHAAICGACGIALR